MTGTILRHNVHRKENSAKNEQFGNGTKLATEMVFFSDEYCTIYQQKLHNLATKIADSNADLLTNFNGIACPALCGDAKNGFSANSLKTSKIRI